MDTAHAQVRVATDTHASGGTDPAGSTGTAGSTDTHAGVATDTAGPASAGGGPGVAVGGCGADVAALLRQVREVATAELPPMGLADGLRPAADVDALVSTVAVAEYELARRLHAAWRARALPLAGEGAVLLARYWSGRTARRITRAGAFMDRHPGIAGPWSAGVITSEHVEALARHADRLTAEEMDAVVAQLADRWGRLSPEQAARFVQRVIRVLHPPPEPDPDECGAYAARSLSFSVLGDSVLLAGCLPRLEGEALINAVDAMAEQMRSAADHVPATARRADGLVALLNAAAAALPSRGGLPVGLSVRMEHTATGDALWTTSLGHHLTPAEQRFTGCAADITAVLVDGAGCAPPDGRAGAPPGSGGLSGRIAALAGTLLDACVPLALGRTRRSASSGQRRALALRDRGCVIPGCRVPPEACQTHHVREWSASGSTDVDNLSLLCWPHHREVDLGKWTLEPVEPGALPPQPAAGAPPGTRWPGNHGSPWIVTAVPRFRWRI